MVQFQLEELAAQVRAVDGNPLVQLEHLRSKAETRQSNVGRGGVHADTLSSFLESLGATVGSSSGDIGRVEYTPAVKANAPASLTQFGHTLRSPLPNLSPISVIPESSCADSMPTYHLEPYKASPGDVIGALNELRNNTAYIRQQMAAQATSPDFVAALKSYQGLIGGEDKAPAINSTLPVGTERLEGAGPEEKKKGSPSEPDHRLSQLTVDTTWAVAYEPSDGSATGKSVTDSPSSMNGSSTSNRNAPSSMNGSSTSNRNATSATNTKKKVNLSIFKSPKQHVARKPQKQGHERLRVDVHASYGAAPMTKTSIPRSERNKSVLEDSLLRRKSFKH